MLDVVGGLDDSGTEYIGGKVNDELVLRLELAMLLLLDPT